MTTDQASARHSPLHQVHLELGASFTDFAGWQMPVRYSSDLLEHHAVRTAAAIFDLSHMAEIRASGTEAAAFLDYALAGILSAIAVGQAKYSLILSEQGGIIDDVIVYRTAENSFLIVANAGNHDAVLAALNERAERFSVAIHDESYDTALIAVQGPQALSVMLATAGIRMTEPLTSLRYYWSLAAEYAGENLLIARTGYTGEDGFELYLPVQQAGRLWQELMASGNHYGLIPAGLAARDTLRLEAGMPLYGHELSREIFPQQAGLSRVPQLTKVDFVGKAALERGPQEGSPVLVGLVSEGKRAARADYLIYSDHDSSEPIGSITSGVLSPSLGYPIAMAYLDPGYAEIGNTVIVDVRGSRVNFQVANFPFYRRKKN